MDPDIAKIVHNPYSSPAGTPGGEEPAPAPRPGSLAIIFPGFVLLLIGYLTSNIFAIGDLYQVSFSEQGHFIPSPLAEVFTTPTQQWSFYGLAAGATIAGCVLIASQNFNPMAVVCYIMCPLVAVVFAVGWPLRVARKAAVPVATAYLAIGTCVAGAGLMQLVTLYGRQNTGFGPVAASMLTEAGLALVVGALVKLWRSGAFTTPAPVAQGDFAAAR